MRTHYSRIILVKKKTLGWHNGHTYVFQRSVTLACCAKESWHRPYAFCIHLRAIRAKRNGGSDLMVFDADRFTLPHACTPARLNAASRDLHFLSYYSRIILFLRTTYYSQRNSRIMRVSLLKINRMRAGLDTRYRRENGIGNVNLTRFIRGTVTWARVLDG